MQRIISLKLLPSEAADPEKVYDQIAGISGIRRDTITGYNIVKQSIDARGKQAWIQLSLRVFISEPFQPYTIPAFEFPDVKRSVRKVLIAGAGPAGLFAALKLIQEGVQPILIERGKDVRARRRDLAVLNKEGIVNPESNYCFGEGGAGTYSDGKLYTRSSKRGDVQRILRLFVYFGAEENILYQAHPHIGTNKLPHIITAMRKKILECGGKFLFDKKLVDLVIKNDKLATVCTADGDRFDNMPLILATGHSATDIFELLYHRQIHIESKPFALGVRVEHPQALIDSAQYHLPFTKGVSGSRGPFLPPASYSLVQQVEGKGVFSFCMCPGGIIAPASTAPGELVVNGWSPSKRNNPYANSGIVVSIEDKDVERFRKSGPLAGLSFQRWTERKAFDAGGGNFVAPAQRLVDFTKDKLSVDLPGCSYLPGVNSAVLKNVLPGFVHKRLQQAFVEFGKKIKAYLTNEAIVVATESRTSSPVRIPRDPHTLLHPGVQNLFPCGEGAGYAGGIVSAAMDGELVADAVCRSL